MTGEGIRDRRLSLDPHEAGRGMLDLITELYPICRSITGDGVRRTLDIVGRQLDLQVHEVPTGTRVFDWVVPREWNIRDAYVADAGGDRVIDFRESNLHVVGYSVPVEQTMSLSRLRERLHTLPEHPDWIPYRTSYYAADWGFCLSDRRLQQLDDGDYTVVVDSSLEDGSLTYAECVVPGAGDEEVLVSCHICHPSLCNDNLSGIAVAAALGRQLRGLSLRYTYRLLFIPGTIGAITWLALNEAAASRVCHGIVLAGVGDAGPCTYKRSRRGDAVVDRAVAHVLAHAGDPYELLDFSPWGYDERQFCSPGFDLPVGRLSRTPHARYPEYHTSADDLSFVRPDSLADSLDTLMGVIEVLEADRTYRSRNQRGEPQLGRRGLYRTMGGQPDQDRLQLALLWVLNLADGDHSLLDVAERSGLPFDLVARAARALVDHDLLDEVEGSAP